jgi:hypothetical protein
MSRDDVANLVIRTFALWLGAKGLGTLGTLPWMIEGPGGRDMIVWYALLLLGAAVILWLAGAPLTRAMVARPDRDVPFALTATGVPPLACFVVGLLTIVAALPAGAGWLAFRVMRYQGASLMASPLDAAQLDLQAAETGASTVAGVVIGAALIAISRRRDLWSTSEDAPTE